MPSKLFGTDGIRGIANRPPLTPVTLARLGQIFGDFSRRVGKGRLVIGRDPRRSGEMIQNALVSGICAAGAHPWLTGVLPTPAVAYLTRSLGADLGLVVSASHNPFPDNGIKLFQRDGTKASEELEREVERALDNWVPREEECPVGADIGQPTSLADAAERYLRGLMRNLPGGAWLKGLRVVFDAANGAAFEVGPQAFATTGATVVSVAVTPNGLNINTNCGATHPELVRNETVRACAHVGVAVDGDGDRVILVDETGRVLDGDDILYILARHGKAVDLYDSPVIVGTAMTNYALERALEALGLRLVRAGVGDRLVSEAMTREGSDLGGEPSGHIVLRRRATTGDGVLCALTVLELARRVGRSLSELRAGFERYPQLIENIPVPFRMPLEQLRLFPSCYQGALAALAGRGRVVVRYSGTEPVLRVMVEAEERELAERWLRELVDCLHRELKTEGASGHT